MPERWFSLAFLVALVALLVPRAARADQPGAHTVSVAVLAFDSEDAEEQADALTSTLRSRVRNAPGWSLVDSTQSLGMLTAALRCPSRPPPDCQQRIAEQIKVDRYIWGYVTKGPTTGQVTAEVHFYQKSKADMVLRESYAENLKDPQDDKGLGKIAARILDRLGGSAMGVVVVKTGDKDGEVIVDGEKHVPLSGGTARIELGAGGHSIEIASPGMPTTKRNVLVTAGRDTVVDIAEQAPPPPPGSGAPAGGGDADTGKPFPTRKVIGGVVAAVGVALEVVMAVNLFAWFDDKSRGDDIVARHAFSVPNLTVDQACDRKAAGTANGNEVDFCNADKDAKNHSRLAIITGSAGAVALVAGAFLFFTASSSTEKTATTPKPKARILPTFGTGSGGLTVVGTF